MPFVAYKTNIMFSITDVAKMAEMDHRQLWHWIRVRTNVEAPATRVGRRDYYTTEQLPRVLDQIRNRQRCEIDQEAQERQETEAHDCQKIKQEVQR